VRALERRPGVAALHRNLNLGMYLSENAPLIRQDKTLTLGTTGQGVVDSSVGWR